MIGTHHPRPSLPRVALVVALLLTSAPALGAQDSDPAPERMRVRRGDLVNIFTGDLHVPADLTVKGSVVCIGGKVTVDGRVTQDVVSILGEARVTGEVGGMISAVTSDLELDGAEVHNEVVSVIGSLKLRDSHVGGDLVKVLGGLDRDPATTIDGQMVGIGIGDWAPDLWALLFWFRLLHKLGVFVLLLLLAAVVPERIRLIADEAPIRFVPAFFTGLLGYVLLWVLYPLLVASVFGIPLIPILGLCALTFKWLGIAAIFFAIGRRIGRAGGRDLSVMGGMFIGFILYTLLMLVPGLMQLPGLLLSIPLRIAFFLVIEVPALGLAILTLGGSRNSQIEAEIETR